MKMNRSRRKVLHSLASAAVTLFLVQGTGCVNIKPVFRKLKARIRKSPAATPEAQRKPWAFPEGYLKTSVEKALNSRCSSDGDNDPTTVHWGMFDHSYKLSDEQVRYILEAADIPRISDLMCETRFRDNRLHFIIDAQAKGVDRDILMIESGMRQQAAALVAAACGTGCLLKSIGPAGRQYSNTEYCTITMRLEPMKPSFDGHYWSTAAPLKENKWKSGNLPDPLRNGDLPLLTALKSLAYERKVSAELSRTQLGQLLWAARGRTPHLYKSYPWGMTIPTWNGRKEVSSTYVCNKDGLFKYLNWEKNRPTHLLQSVGSYDKSLYENLKSLCGEASDYLLIRPEHAYPAALWEVGYSAISILLQLQTMKASYTAIFADQDQKRSLGGMFGNTGVVIALG